jgi:hypothetical protein
MIGSMSSAIRTYLKTLKEQAKNETTYFVLFVPNPLTPPRDSIRYGHRWPLRDLHLVSICLDELAQDLCLRVLWVPKIHHLIKQFILYTEEYTRNNVSNHSNRKLEETGTLMPSNPNPVTNSYVPRRQSYLSVIPPPIPRNSA